MKRIIIDADTGVDDSWPSLYALRSPNFRVEGSPHVLAIIMQNNLRTTPCA